MGWEKEPEDGVVEGLLGFEVVVDVVVVVVGRAEVLRWWSSMGSDGSMSSSLFSCKLRIKVAFRNSLDRVRLFFRSRRSKSRIVICRFGNWKFQHGKASQVLKRDGVSKDSALHRK